jgi:hypothetical protein
MADQDADGMTGLAPYRASKAWEFGSRDAPPAPKDALVRTYGYGEGVAGWAAYLAPGESVAQYLNLKLLLSNIGETGGYPTEAHNQCGLLAVGDATGLSLEEVYRAFLDIGEIWDAQANDGKGGFKPTRQILRNDESLEHTQLKALFEALGYTAQIVAGGDGTLGALAGELHKGKLAIPLVAINSSGAVDAKGTTAHWVRVQSIDTDRTGVALYNPFRNTRDTSAEEGVPAEVFGQAWATTPKNTSSSIVVLARPE